MQVPTTINPDRGAPPHGDAPIIVSAHHEADDMPHLFAPPEQLKESNEPEDREEPGEEDIVADFPELFRDTPVRRFIPWLAGLACASGFAFLFAGETHKRNVPISKRPTHAELEAKRSAANSSTFQNANLKVLEPGTVQRRDRTKSDSLIGRSTILSSGTQWTLVPKGSVVFVPPSYRTRVDGKRSGTLVDWSTFHQRNRGWIHVLDVSMAQARGEAPLSEEVVKTYQRLGRVVVAACHRGPISVKEYEAPATEPVTTP